MSGQSRTHRQRAEHQGAVGDGFIAGSPHRARQGTAAGKQKGRGGGGNGHGARVGAGGWILWIGGQPPLVSAAPGRAIGGHQLRIRLQAKGIEATPIILDESLGQGKERLRQCGEGRPEHHQSLLEALAGGLDVASMTKVQKLAVLLIILGPESAAQVLKHQIGFTAIERHEQELLDAKRQAEQASSAKSDFLAKISHEIRTPLNAIIGFSEVMMEERFGPVGNDRYRQYLRDIHTSGGHLISLLNDLLDLSKIEAGKLELNFTKVDLNVLTQQCVALMQPQANRERVIKIGRAHV